MRKITLLISILLVIILQSCFKEKECREPTEGPPIEQEMRDWIIFQPGSYWIYLDSITNTTDSVFVVETQERSEVTYIKNKKCPHTVGHVAEITMASSLGGKYFISGGYGIGTGAQNDTTNTRGASSIRNINHAGGDGGHSLYMFFPVVQGTIGAWNGFTFIKHDTIYSTYGIAGKQYENVLRVHDTGNGAYNAETKFYHAKHIGVIKKEIYEMDKDNPNPKLLQVWELTDYKVIQ
ncbi:MAG: hypothetical protein KF882_09505 [Bacteroidia bacterium]|nr:hypothetical protein [Bacteroidia bacterium]MCO5254910.1 hypothetical protein [Bacteroidota bacterium]